MKIIYIANLRLPTEKAHGIQIMKMCQAFAYFAEVELVVPKRLNPIKTGAFEYYGLAQNFNIKRLSCLDFIIFDKYIGHFGLWIESLTFFFSVFWYILFKKIDILYTRDKFFLPLALIRKNIIFEAHTLPRNYFLYSLFFRKLSGVAVITQKLKDLLAEKGAPSDKVLVAPDGVDLVEFDIKETKDECRTKLNLPANQRIVLYTGHLYDWKGTRALAEASRFLPGDSEIYFVGGTVEDIKKFRAQNTKYRIQIVGHRPHQEIPYWLKAADVLVLPNSAKEDISRLWTSPMKMFEYMASGRPIVASNLPSLSEILNASNAVLVEPDNPEKLAQGIRKILDDSQLAQRISEKALKDVQNYSWQERAEKILGILKN